MLFGALRHLLAVIVSLPLVLGAHIPRTAPLVPRPSLEAPAPAAPIAPPCGFAMGFAAIHAAIPSIVGDCLEDEHQTFEGEEQLTSGGKLVWDARSNRAAFTDGYETWLQAQTGLVKRLNSERYDWESGPVWMPGYGVKMIATSPVTPAQTSAALSGIPEVVQTLNNCGPASISEVLSYWGIAKSQAELQQILRPNNPWGMSSYGVPPYVESIGMKAFIASSGTNGLLKMLVANGLPPIVIQWVAPDDSYRHYRPITGYDDQRGFFLSQDPYLGAGHQIAYPDFDTIWNYTGRAFMVIYPPQKENLLKAVLATASALAPDR